ncbi:MAG TPA: hypothetical protein PLH80_07230 [Spirochaetota bacterium]|jgi:peptide methionine sulfoxide reductase MsrB|nr:hypothetical protein [Spirochaetota bacterium]HOT19577.1 hypothetical protein [Spirochaetota bacterium]HPD05540.1 hypothetical protein [Spirochaetota bacterium]HQG41429.1 hypothetical protein [Spirochaetota bacterium]HQI38337.1 hypothetical protein [Spirochaetota bacterium]
MTCDKCGAEINRLNHYYIPGDKNTKGKRYCIRCAKEEKIVTLI